MTVKDQDLLDEIRYDIQVKDLIKGKLVLTALEHVTRDAQRAALAAVREADDDYAVPLLATVIAENPTIGEAFPQLRETLLSKVLNAPQVLCGLIAGSENSPLRTLLVEIAGELRLKHAAPVLTTVLTGVQDVPTIEAAINALGMIGEGAAADAISEHLYAGNREVVTAAVHALGQLGTVRALEHLAQRLGIDRDLDLAMIDILAKSEAPEALEWLNNTLSSDHAHIRSAGKKKMLGIGMTAIRVLVGNLTRKNPDLVIHSLNVLGDMKDGGAIAPIRSLLHDEPDDPNVRFAAYEALGKLPLGKGAFVLAAGLEDRDSSVRAAAAKAIDQNFNPALGAGLMNLMQSGDEAALEMIRTVIDAECDTIFAALLEQDYFKGPAMAYLKKKAHPDVRRHFVEILKKKEGQGLAERGEMDGARQKGRIKVFAVDDSKMILNIYRKILHNLGVESRLFEFPAGALERVRQDRPDIIFTDLNMPDISGIDLTKAVRTLYDKKELPIVMVTTQDEGRDKEAARAAGINAILQKPFTEEQIGAVIAEFRSPVG